MYFESALASEQVAFELATAKRNECIVIPLLLEPAFKLKGLPLFEQIEDLQWIDGSQDREDAGSDLLRTLRRRGLPTTPVLAVCNLKGGVGKTTLSAYLSSSIYRRYEASILLVDVDPQSNLSQFILHEDELDLLRQNERSVISCFEAGVLYRQTPAASSLTSVCHVPVSEKTFRNAPHYFEDNKTKRLGLIAGQFEIVKYTVSANHGSLAIARDNFKRTILESRRNFDLVVLDLNPSSSFLIECALGEATHLLCPVRPDRYSLEGVSALRRLIHEVLNRSLDDRMRLVLNGAGWNVQSAAEEALRNDEFYGSRLIDVTIPQSDMLAARYDRAALEPVGLARFFGLGNYGGQMRKRLDDVADRLMDFMGLVTLRQS